MRLIRKNVEREAEGSAAEKLISDGFTPMKKATPDTVPEEKIGKDIEDIRRWEIFRHTHIRISAKCTKLTTDLAEMAW